MVVFTIYTSKYHKIIELRKKMCNNSLVKFNRINVNQSAFFILLDT